MRRQMRTAEIHHKTKDFQVETQTGRNNRGKQATEIVIIDLNTARAKFTDLESVEWAIELCNRQQTALDKHAAKIAAEREAEAKAEAERAAAEARGPLATDRQVSYIMSLLAQHDGQNITWYSQGPTDPAEIAKMTRRDASTYISALLGE